MSVVIDASVALKWVLDEPGQDEAERLLDEELSAPALWLAEAANALWRRARHGEILAEQASERLAELLSAPVTTTPVEWDIVAAAGLAATLGHPVYDCLYLASAIRENTHAVTSDRRFCSVVDRSDAYRGRVRMLVDPA